MNKKILLMTTGGTIASAKTSNGLVPSLCAEEIISYIPEIEEICKVDTQEICNIDSTNMTYEYWLKIADKIKKEYDNYDGFVICHGTDTMAYTASALSYLIQNSSKPIVLTGAQKPIQFEITDAKANLRDSIIYASDDKSCDVSIVFDGRVIAGTRAKKTKTISYHAFSSINFPCIAVVSDTKIIRYIEPPMHNTSVKFYDELNPRVFLLKLTPGIKPIILETVFEHYDCIIVESFGSGGIPDSLINEFSNQLKKYAPQEKIIIMTTQVMKEGSNVGIYEVGSRIKENFSVLEAYDMNLEAVITKIMWILAMKNLTWEKIEELFYKKINYDILVLR